MISESKVSVEEIRDRIGQDVKIANIVELLDIEKGIIPLDEMYEKGEQIRCSDTTKGKRSARRGNVSYGGM